MPIDNVSRLRVPNKYISSSSELQEFEAHLHTKERCRECGLWVVPGQCKHCARRPNRLQAHRAQARQLATDERQMFYDLQGSFRVIQQAPGKHGRGYRLVSSASCFPRSLSESVQRMKEKEKCPRRRREVSETKGEGQIPRRILSQHVNKKIGMNLQKVQNA